MVVLGPVDEVGNNQEIAGELHFSDNTNLHVEPLFIGFRLFRGKAVSLSDFPESFFKAVTGGLVEHRIKRFTFRHREVGEIIGAELKLEMTARGNLRRGPDGVRGMGKGLFHLVRGFEVELVGGKTEPGAVVNSFAGLDAQKDFMRMGLVPVQIMAVVGCHQRDVEFAADFLQALVGNSLFLDAVFLHFKVEAVAKDVLEKERGLFGGLHVFFLGNEIGDLAVQTAGQGNEPLVVFGKELLVDPGLIIKTLQLGDGGKLHEIFITGRVHGQENDMKCRLTCASGIAAIGAFFRRNIEFAADDRL